MEPSGFLERHCFWFFASLEATRVALLVTSTFATVPNCPCASAAEVSAADTTTPMKSLHSIGCSFSLAIGGNNLNRDHGAAVTSVVLVGPMGGGLSLAVPSVSFCDRILHRWTIGCCLSARVE